MFNIASLLLKPLSACGWYLAAFAAGAVLSWQFTSEHYQHKMDEVVYESQIQYQTALTEKAKLEADYHAKLSDLQSQLVQDTDEIDARYSDAVSGFNDRLSVFWLQHSDAGGGNGVPEPAGAAAGDKSTSCPACRCPKPDRTKLQRLFEQQMTLARDCDINQTYFKRLVNLYEEIRNR